MENKFDKLFCNGNIYNRELVLKEIEDWVSKNIVMQYQLVRVINPRVTPELFNLFNIQEHLPAEYKQRNLNGMNFLSNVILECGLKAGREEKECQYKSIIAEKDKKILEQEKYIKDLERKLQEPVKPVKKVK